jgi:tripartite-type tricarboxylate transporter receptor subunit TctC
MQINTDLSKKLALNCGELPWLASPQMGVERVMVKVGKLRALAVSTKVRSRVAPDIPTLDEVGVTGFDATAWFGLFAPAATPNDIIHQLSLEVADALKDPLVSDKMLQLGAEPMSSTPEAFGAFFKSEVSKWARVVQTSKVQME